MKFRKQGVILMLLMLTMSLFMFGCAQSNTSSAKAGKQSTNTTTSATSVASGGELKVHYINVGQADSILVQQGNSNMLIDAGNNVDAKTIVDYLKSQGVRKLDYVIGTHPHADHIGSMDVVIKTFDVGKVYMPKETSNTKTYKDVITSIKAKNLKITAPKPGESFKLGEAECTILAPNSDKYKDINDTSIVLKVAFGQNKFLFEGDAESTSEKEMLAKGFDAKADVIKLGHHGSHSSSSNEFLDKVQPSYAVISCGGGNDYGHPHKKTMDKLKQRKVKVFRTDESGTVVITSDGKNIKCNAKEGSYVSPRK